MKTQQTNRSPSLPLDVRARIARQIAESTGLTVAFGDAVAGRAN